MKFMILVDSTLVIITIYSVCVIYAGSREEDFYYERKVLSQPSAYSQTLLTSAKNGKEN